MLATLANHRHNRQIRDRIKPLVRRAARRLGCCSSGLAQVPYAREVPQVLQANSGQPGYLFFCEDLLARSDCEAAHIWLHPACSQYGDGISELCFLAIVLPFHYVDFFDAEPSQWGLRKRLRRGVLNAVVFGRGKNQH